MTSWQRKVFRIIGPLWEESTCHSHVDSIQKSLKHRFEILSLSSSDLWINSQLSCDFRHHNAHVNSLQLVCHKSFLQIEYNRVVRLELISCACHAAYIYIYIYIYIYMDTKVLMEKNAQQLSQYHVWFRCIYPRSTLTCWYTYMLLYNLSWSVEGYCSISSQIDIPLVKKTGL